MGDPEFAQDMDKYNVQMSVYILAFGNLNLRNTIKALGAIVKDEELSKQFKNLPIPTLARESVKITEFDAEEKKRYIDSKKHIFYVDTDKKMMRAVNKAKTSERMPQWDRPFTPLEEDFYINHKMTVEEYEYFSGKTSTKPNYNNYDPRSRTNKI